MCISCFFCFFFLIFASWSAIRFTLCHAKSLQPSLTLFDPMDCRPPGSSVHGFSRQEYWSGLPFPTPGDLPHPGIRPVSLASPALAGRFLSLAPPGKSLSRKVEVLVAQLCPTLCDSMDYSLPDSILGIFQARILEWVAISYSRGSSPPRGQTRVSCVSCIASRFFTCWAIEEALDSILKGRDITLPTKVCLVKAMVFPVVMYGYESWTIKKAEGRRIIAF